MPKFILIKHAAPEVVPGVSSEQWRLSEKGRASCNALAEAVREHRPVEIVASEEPKASETAQLIAEQMGVPWKTARDLHEHDRRNVPHLHSGEFISFVELMLRKRDQLVLGNETANEALRRFDAAVQRILDSYPDENVAIVAHGTVIALFAEAHSDEAAFSLWRRLGLPSFVVMSRPELHLEQIVPRI